MKVLINFLFTLEEAPSLQVQAYNITTSTVVIAWKPLQENKSGVIVVSGYKVIVESQLGKAQVKLVNTSTSSLSFEDLKAFTSYCVIVEPLTALVGLGREDCHYFITDEGSKTACFVCHADTIHKSHILRDYTSHRKIWTNYLQSRSSDSPLRRHNLVPKAFSLVDADILLARHAIFPA